VVLRESIDVNPDTGASFVQPQAKKVNGGDVTIWGVEFSAIASFNERWSGRLAVGYQDAEWDSGTLDSLFEYPSFGGPECFDTTPTTPVFLVPTPPECQNNLAGQTLSRQPAWQGAASLTYQRPVFGGDWEWFTRGDLTYEDSWYPQDDNMANIPEHTFANLSLGFKSDRWTITAWVNNLFEEDDPTSTFRDVALNNTDDFSQSRPLVGRGPNQIIALRYSVVHPRLTTYGLTVQARFGAASM
jgi:outer membrane receptor protein involved in Fe transport